MNITRHNYEEYFILYMDNELSAEQRRMVEDFIQQHPDLKEELDTLLQYKLAPDTDIFFEGKEELLKQNGHSIISENNYPEWLSLYIDDELSIEQKQLVEKFVVANPAAQAELELLQKIKLQPEQVVFAHKELLYRKEERARRITPFYWRAAAAVLIIALGLSAVLVLNKKPTGSDSEIAGKNQEQPVIKEEKNTGLPGNNSTKEEVASKQKEAAGSTPFIAEIKNQPLPVNNNAASQKTVATVTRKKNNLVSPANTTGSKQALPKKEESVVAGSNNKPSNNLPQPSNNPNIIQGNNKPQDALATNSKPENTSKPLNTTNPNVTSAGTQPSDIVQASYKENNEALEQPDGKKNKNRGIFRKIARTFEKRTNIDPTDDNRLLVAGLAIKLK